MTDDELKAIADSVSDGFTLTDAFKALDYDQACLARMKHHAEFHQHAAEYVRALLSEVERLKQKYEDLWYDRLDE